MYTIPYYSAAEQEWAAVTIPKIIRDDPVDPAQFDKFLDRPLPFADRISMSPAGRGKGRGSNVGGKVEMCT